MTRLIVPSGFSVRFSRFFFPLRGHLPRDVDTFYFRTAWNSRGLNRQPSSFTLAIHRRPALFVIHPYISSINVARSREERFIANKP